MEEKGAASPPSGYVAFCREPEGACGSDRVAGGAPRAMDARGLLTLDRLNRAVNAAIAPAEDSGDVWRADASSGDCEDYALAKRAALMAAGWAASQALIAVAEDRWGRPHAVLIARTSLGDYVLDSLTDELLRWDSAALTFRSRQSARLPAFWVKL